MMSSTKTPLHLSLLTAGLLAFAGAHAQSTPAAGTSDLPPKAGEASTQTMGAPNAQTTNSAVGDVSAKDQMRQDAQNRDTASATSSVPPKAGEASAMVQGKPNADPNGKPMAKTRAEVRAELMASRSNYEANRKAMRSGSATMTQ